MLPNTAEILGRVTSRFVPGTIQCISPSGLHAVPEGEREGECCSLVLRLGLPLQSTQPQSFGRLARAGEASETFQRHAVADLKRPEAGGQRRAPSGHSDSRAVSLGFPFHSLRRSNLWLGSRFRFNPLKGVLNLEPSTPHLPGSRVHIGFCTS